MQSECDGKIETVIGGLVDDNEAVFLQSEIIQIDVVFWSGKKIAHLANLCLERNCMEELHDMSISGMRTEMTSEENIDRGFQHECVIYGDHPDIRAAEPAWLPPPCVRCVHDIVGNEEEGLQKLDQPT